MTIINSTISSGLDEPFLAGQPVPQGVPGVYDIALAGRPYRGNTVFEPYRRESYRSQSVPPIADKSDISNLPGEASVNTQGLWRRSMVDWSSGAGQLFLDRSDENARSFTNRFRRSKGIDPWTQWQASLLPDTLQVRASGSITQVLVVGVTAWIIDGGNVFSSTGGSGTWTWTPITGIPQGSATMLASDSYNVYIACGTNGLYLATGQSATSAAEWISGSVGQIWYVSGLLVAAYQNSLYQITTSTSTAGPTALPGALFTQQASNFVFTAAAAGNSWVYISGQASGTPSQNSALVYKTQMNSNGTALITPLVAATLPGGEHVFSLYAYTNYIMVGTSLGCRFCETLGINDPGGNAGDLKMGPIVPDQIQQVQWPVKAFTGRWRWVWFGWSGYDGNSTGLGRMDLSTFIDQQAPSYTSDLMVNWVITNAQSGQILSLDWWAGSDCNSVAPLINLNGGPIFVVQNAGLYVTAPTYVSQGSIDTGYITFGLPDNKIGLWWDCDATGTGTIGGQIVVDDSETSPPQLTPQSPAGMLIQQALPTLVGEKFEPTIYLNAPSGNASTPILRRWMMKALPAVVSATQFLIVIDLYQTEQAFGMDVFVEPILEWQFLDQLRQDASPVTYNEGGTFAVTVVIKQIDWLRYKPIPVELGGGFEAVLVIMAQSLEN